MAGHPREMFPGASRPRNVTELNRIEQLWVRDIPGSVLLKQVGRGGRR